ncbi:NAD(P)-dependent oxidoreductase [Chloroflexota bacterium]
MSLSVHVLGPRYGDDAMRYLRANLHPDVLLTFGEDVPNPADYHVLVTGRPQREHLTASRNLRAVIVPWAGIPEPTHQLMLEFQHVAVHNLHHNALPVAEQAIALLLAAAKFLVPMDRSLRSGDWRPRYGPSPSLLLEGRTALVLGYGAIGQKVACLCQGLGMAVKAVRHQSPAASERARDGIPIAGVDELHDLLPLANVLIVCLPHTPETMGIVGSPELGLLPPDAVLVNIGRGPTVDEAALYQALRDGTLYAAGLDVWYNYPADEAARSSTSPSKYPIHELDNVVMSPHRAGGSTGTERLRVIHLAKLLNAAASGEPMPNEVDLLAGY